MPILYDSVKYPIKVGETLLLISDGSVVRERHKWPSSMAGAKAVKTTNHEPRPSNVKNVGGRQLVFMV